MNRLILRALIFIFLSLVLFALIGFLVGESPVIIVRDLLFGGFATQYDFGRTLFYATPLILTGLAVALPLKAGLFNIGGEGQLYVGAFGGFFVAQMFPTLSPTFALPLGVLSCFVFGSLWGAVAGWIRAYRGGHEVIATIMLNYVAVALTTYLTLNFFRTNENQNPETFRIPEAFQLTPWNWTEGASVSIALFIGMLLCVAFYVWEKKSVAGFRIGAVGQNANAARVNRINVKQIQFLSLMVGGGLAGLVGFAEVMGNSHRFQVGFSLDYGFMGIAVSLVARKNFLLIVPAALFFGGLNQGATILQFNSEKMISEVVLSIQAFFILLVTLWNSTSKSLRR